MGVFDKVKGKLGFGEDEEEWGSEDYEQSSGRYNPFADRGGNYTNSYDDYDSYGSQSRTSDSYDSYRDDDDYSASRYGYDSSYDDSYGRNESLSSRAATRDYGTGYSDTSSVRSPARSSYSGWRDTNEDEELDSDYRYTGGPQPSSHIAAPASTSGNTQYEFRTSSSGVSDPIPRSQSSRASSYSSYESSSGAMSNQRTQASPATAPYNASIQNFQSANPGSSVGTPIKRASAFATVVIIEAKSYDDIQEISTKLKGGKPVVLSLQSIRSDLAVRLLDFSFGLVSGLEGQVEKISDKTFLLTTTHARLLSEDRTKLVSMGYMVEEY